ncbi:MAG: extracellular solute-binding protein [Acetobacteraceae bacterium]|nr:extracellular solute-binding protein [Acetobacteraceae bacterium]
MTKQRDSGFASTTTRRRLLLGAAAGGAALAAPPIIRVRSASVRSVRWWYFFDDPNAAPDALVSEFQKLHPDIRIDAERIPNNGGADYATRLYSALLAGQGPDVAMMKIANLSRLLEMEALLPIDSYLASWPGRGDIAEQHWKLAAAPDGKAYILPVQYVVLYLYIRQDWLDAAKMAPPKTLDEMLEVARAMTGKDRWGIGVRGGAGGQDFWASVVMGEVPWEKGAFVKPAAVAANDWYLDLFRKYKVTPPSTPGDGFQQTINNLKAGRTGMTIHHIGSASGVVESLGNRITAVPLPGGPRGAWATYGDGGQSIFAKCKDPDAAWAWISWLSAGEPNAAFNRLTGQVPVATSMAKNWTEVPKRFVDATVNSLPIARILPNLSQTADFVRTVWPQATQKAFLGQISSAEMMGAFEKLYFS